MTSPPSHRQGLKRQRQETGAGTARADSVSSPTEPSREARVAWSNDFPSKFQVLEKIGEGSFGTVWLCRRRRKEGGSEPSMRQKHQREGGREEEEEEDGEEEDELVALKRINPTCSPSRILNEFQQMQKLGGGRDNNVIQVQGVVRTPGGVFALAMPFFEHDDFRQVMKTLTLSGVAAYTRSLLTALAHVHEEGVIHRDIKPRNFMYNTKTGQGLLIDFGLAEPAEKWKCRSEALARHRDKRDTARGKKNQALVPQQQKQTTPLSASSKTGSEVGLSSTRRRQGPAAPPEKCGGSGDAVGGRLSVSSGRGKEDRLKLLRKVERGGTTGFRAPEILWRCRDQEPAVDVWSAGVILLCLLSRRYPVFPSADTDEMALVQIAQLLPGGSEEIVRAARKSGRCHIAEFPSSQQPRRGGGGGSRLEELCAPLLGGGGAAAAACDEEEGRARADALSLLKGMLKVDPRERLSAKGALVHPFVAEA